MEEGKIVWVVITVMVEEVVRGMDVVVGGVCEHETGQSWEMIVEKSVDGGLGMDLHCLRERLES